MSPSSSPSESALTKFVISGSVTWAYELVVGHYMEFLKIAKQTNPTLSYAQLTAQMTKEKGLAGVLDGYFPWGSIQAIAKGAVFGAAHTAARNKLEQNCVAKGWMSSGTAEILAGGIGGGFQGLVLSPTLLLKTRVMTDPMFRQKMSMGETTRASFVVGARVIRTEGLSALMKGAGVFSMKRVGDWTTRYFFAVSAENILFRRGDMTRSLSAGERITSSLIGGTMSACVTLPIDVMVAQIQKASSAGTKVGVVETFRQEFAAGGWNQVAGFATRGFVARAGHVALTTMLLKTGTSYVYEFFHRK